MESRGFPESAKAGNEGGEIAARLSWKDLTVVVNSNQTVLHGISGVAEPGRLVAVMGPSGSGKSTLLDTLAGRPSRNATVTGDILLNGHRTELTYGTAAYLTQEVFLLGTLTVYETLYFSAKLRFPDSLPDVEVRQIVKEIIEEVGLTGAIHTPIGNYLIRGVSGGEKRRVSIAIELLTSPRLLFLDEPTSGLDSASAYHVVCTLKNLARDHGCTVISSIHQPSSEVYDIFDDLCLLSGGQQVYFGPLDSALQFFADTGFPCPTLRNPSDHYLHCINSDFDHVENILRIGSRRMSSRSMGSKRIGSRRMDSRRVSMEIPTQEHDLEGIGANRGRGQTAAEAVKSLVLSFAGSKERMNIDTKIQAWTEKKGERLDSRGSQASFLRQSLILTRRSMINMNRDVGYFWFRLVMYAFVCVAIGATFYKLGQSYIGIQPRATCLAYAVGFLTFMAVGGFPSFVEDIKVFVAERLNGHYTVGSFVVGNTLSSIPFLGLMSLSSSTIVYFMADFHGGVEHFVYFVLTLFASLLCVESLMMAIASLVPNFLMGIIVGAGIQGTFMLVSGFFRLPSGFPKPIWRFPISYMAWHSYAFQGMMQNDFLGLMFENINPADPPLTGAYVLHKNFEIPLNRSKWWDLGIIFLMIAFYRVFFYVLIRVAETLLPIFRAFMSKKLSSRNVSLNVPPKASSFDGEKTTIQPKDQSPAYA